MKMSRANVSKAGESPTREPSSAGVRPSSARQISQAAATSDLGKENGVHTGYGMCQGGGRDL